MTDRASRRAVGTHYEEEAARYLEQQGYQILERNFFSRYGEIDLIAKDEDTLVFVEVKYRSGASFGDPAEAVTAKSRSGSEKRPAIISAHASFPRILPAALTWQLCWDPRSG